MARSAAAPDRLATVGHLGQVLRGRRDGTGGNRQPDERPADFVSRRHVAILVVASIVAFIAGKWVVGTSVLVVAYGLGLLVAFMERWDRSRRGVSKSQDS